MGMYTDEELSWAAKIAYFNISEKDINDFIRDKGDYPTLQQIFKANGEELFFKPSCINAENPTGDDLKMKESVLAFIDDVISGEICQGWKVVSVCDQNNKDGMYGLTIETDSQDAIIAFRGSEATNGKQVIEDWVSADFNIMNGKLTRQEESALQYLDKVANQFDYENFAVTGHSLGGDLALVSTVLSASDKSESDISDRIRQSVSFDGPGHPEEFIAKYEKEIYEMKEVMTHYQWSLVGACLTSLCERFGRYIYIRSDSFEDPVVKHAMESLGFEEDGSLSRATQMDDLAMQVHNITTKIDNENILQFALSYELKVLEMDARAAYYWLQFETSAFLKYLEILPKITEPHPIMLNFLLKDGMSDSAKASIIQAAFIAGLTGGHIGSDMRVLLGDWVIESLADTEADYTEARAVRALTADPLVVDLDGDGFELLPVEEGVYFDENHMGLKEKTQWAAPDDALLAIDLNGDGMINDGSELFGTSTLLKDGTLAESGFEALAQQDENGDGIVDIKDSGFSKLLVWQDKNSDGISQQDELHTLEELGIESISLNHRNADGINTADITFADGTTTQIGEFDFDARLYDSMEKEEVEISEEIKGLPNVRAIGNVASLHTLMQMDDTGKLKEYVAQFTQADSIREREEIVTQMLYFITGAGEVAASSRGGQFDAQKLTVIEQFLGRDFVGTAGQNPVNTAAGILNGIYDNIFELYYNLLNGQTALKDCLSMTVWTTDGNGGRYLNTQIFNAYIDSCISEGLDMSNVVAEMGRYIVSVNPGNKINFADYVKAYSGKSDYLKAIAEASRKSVISGTEESDRLDANGNHSFLVGLEGNDTLNGGTSNDFLYGGRGNDQLNGGNGSDTYFFELGDGQDTINNYDREGWRNDRILFGEGISPEDIKVSRQGYYLVLENTKSGDKVTVQNAFSYADGSCFIGKVEFSDGTVWEPEDIKEMLRTFRGTEGNDSLRGFDNGYNYNLNETFYGEGGNDTIDAGGGDDFLYGGEGNDILNGWDGDDFLHGGTGNDTLNGGNGSDTYFFELGDGEDTINHSDREGWRNDRILFGEGISPEDMKVSRQWYSLVLENVKSDDKVTVNNAFSDASGSSFIGKVEFSDGTVWEPEDIKELLRTFRGTEGNDSLRGFDNGYNYDLNETFYGEGGNDTIDAGGGDDFLYGGEGDDTLNGWDGDDFLHGGTGNDTLNGGNGNDTYFFELGDGEDIINNSDREGWRNDRILFGEGISPEDMKVSRQWYSLVLENTKSGDRVTVNNAFSDASGSCFIGKVEFSDGTLWEPEDIKEMLRTFRGTEGNDSLRGFDNGYNYDLNETFYGEGGNDTIDAGGGDDILYGGSGNDILNGWDGNDFLHGGTGNDNLNGGNGSDTYFFELGDGEDTINNSDREGWRNDRILFGEGISPEDMKVSRQWYSLVLENEKSGDRVMVNNAFSDASGSSFIGKVEFSDGTLWEPEDIKEMLRTFHGTGGNDSLRGFDNGYNYDLNETFYGEDGNDTIDAGGGDDFLYGGEGDDTLNGWDGNDFLHGGTGNDTLNGGNGNDTYFFELGDGNDTITDYDAAQDNSDTLCMNVEAEKLQFSRIGADLLVFILGTDDSVTIKNWYYGDAYHVENIQSSDGYSLAHTQIDQLIQAMASFEDASGMSWQEAVASEDDSVNQLVSQMWVKQGA